MRKRSNSGRLSQGLLRICEEAGNGMPVYPVRVLGHRYGRRPGHPVLEPVRRRAQRHGLGAYSKSVIAALAFAAPFLYQWRHEAAFTGVLRPGLSLVTELFEFLPQR